MKLRCLVVDDEKLAQEVLVHHISKFDELQLEGVCNNVFELISFLNKHNKIDLIFLDIKMPEISGTEFANMFNNPPAIVYTTAFNNYAVDAFNQNAIDYLLKPISLERFSKSIQKAMQILLPNYTLKTDLIQSNNNVFYVKSDKRIIKIDPLKIVYIEAMGNYLCLYTEDEKIMIHCTMVTIENNLKNLNFICRVHKSFFVNLNKINFVEQHTIVLENKKTVPIGLSYRDQVYQKIKII